MQPDKFGNKPGSKQQPPGQGQNPMRPPRSEQGMPANPPLEEEEEEESGTRREEDGESTGIQPGREQDQDRPKR
jgi:hypothetical protein